MMGVARRSLALSLLALVAMAVICLAADPTDADRATACVDMVMPGAPEDLRELMKRFALLERDSESQTILSGGDADSASAHTSGYDRPDAYYEPGYNSYGRDAYGSHGDYDYHAPASTGNITKSEKELLIDNVITFPGDTASAGLKLVLAAASPSSGDGNYGKWGAYLRRRVGIKDTDKKPFLTIQGDAADPVGVTVWGQLSDAGLVPTLKTIGAVPSVSLYGVLGYVPDTFKVDPSPTKCLYRAKCPTNINSFTLEGTVSVSHSGPKLEKESLYELAGRSWFPKHPVKFVCTFKTDQMSGPAQC